MENRIPVGLLLFFMFAGIFTIPAVVFGYSQTTTHPALTDEIVDYYNLVFDSRSLLPQEKEWVVKGSIDEDAGLRYLNHFYDPVHNAGWKGFTSSKKWATSSFAQSMRKQNLAGLTFASIDDPGDFSWERALKDYAKGDEERAFVALGHVLHLIEDASVPEHTRDDTHFGHGQFGSPYENWAEKFARGNLDLASSLFVQGLKPVVKDSIEEYFDDMAAYSNTNFFSEDTIFSQRYDYPIVRGFEVKEMGKKKFLFSYGLDGENRKIYLFFKPDQPIRRNLTEKVFTIKDDHEVVLTDYWQRLSRKAVAAGAGVVGLFLRDATIARELYQKEAEAKKGLFDWLLGMVGGRSLSEDPHALAAAVARVASEGAKGAESRAFPGIADALALPDEDAAYESGVAKQRENALSNTDKSLSKDAEARARQGDEVKDKIEQASIPKREGNAQGFLTNKSSHAPSSLAEERKSEIKEGEEEKQSPEFTKGKSEASSPLSAQKVAAKNASSSSSKGGGGGGGESAFCPLTTSDAPLHSVLLSEVAWSGTSASSFNEWIELYNPSPKETSLAGWRLQNKARDIQVVFPLALRIASQGYLLFERTDDASVPGIPADFIYHGALRDTEETLALFDAACRLIDKVDATPDWPAGSKSPERRSMERSSDLAWHTFAGDAVSGIWGTPRAFNSIPRTLQATGEASSAKDTSSSNQLAAPPLAPSYRKGDVTFSEVAWMGTAAGATHEWIELKSNATSSIALKGWRIEKGDGSILVGETGDEFKDTHSIDAKGYFLLERSEEATSVASDKLYDGTLNNGGETLILKDPLGNEIARVEMALSWQAGKETVSAEGYKPTMSNFGSAQEASWSDGKPTPKAANEVVPASPPPVPLPSFAPQTLAISEIAWMGDSESANNEWIELFNNATSSVDLAGWTLEADDKTPSIALSGSVAAQSYLLLERTNDESVKGVAADLIYTGALGNAGEALALKDGAGNEIDRVSAWHAGDNDTKETMQRINLSGAGNDAANWLTAPATPKTKTPVCSTKTTYQPGESIAIDTVWCPSMGAYTILIGPHTLPQPVVLAKEASLTILAGTTVSFAPATPLAIPLYEFPYHGKSAFRVEGKLNALGFASKKIAFLVKDTLNGFNLNPSYATQPWESSMQFFLVSLENSGSAALDYATIDGASSPEISLFNVKTGDVAITRSEFTSAFMGISLQASLSKEPLIQNNTFKNFLFTISSTQVGFPVVLGATKARVEGNTGQNNASNGILVAPNSVLAGNIVWYKNAAFPYMIQNNAGPLVPGDSTLTLQPGASVEMRSIAAVFTVKGTIKALGETSNRVTFSSKAGSGLLGSAQEIMLIDGTKESAFLHTDFIDFGIVDVYSGSGSASVPGIKVINTLQSPSATLGTSTSSPAVLFDDASFRNVLRADDSNDFVALLIDNAGVKITNSRFEEYRGSQFEHAQGYDNGTGAIFLNNATLELANSNLKNSVAGNFIAVGKRGTSTFINTANTLTGFASVTYP